jgi:hypothetical protein
MHVFLPTSWSWTWVLSLHIFWAAQASFFAVRYSFKAIELLNGQKPNWWPRFVFRLLVPVTCSGVCDEKEDTQPFSPTLL